MFSLGHQCLKQSAICSISAQLEIFTFLMHSSIFFSNSSLTFGGLGLLLNSSMLMEPSSFNIFLFSAIHLKKHWTFSLTLFSSNGFIASNSLCFTPDDVMQAATPSSPSNRAMKGGIGGGGAFTYNYKRLSILQQLLKFINTYKNSN